MKIDWLKHRSLIKFLLCFFFISCNSILAFGGVKWYLSCSKEDPGRIIYKEWDSYREHFYYTLCDSENHRIANLGYGFYIFDSSDIKRFKSGNSYYIRLHKKSGYGLIDDNGNTVIPFQYDGIDNVIYGSKRELSGCVKVLLKGHDYGLYKISGEPIIPCVDGNFFYWVKGFIEMSNNYTDMRMLLDHEGNILINNAKSIIEDTNGFLVTLSDGTKGLYSTDKKWIVPPEWGYSSFKEFQGPERKRYYRVCENSSKSYGVISLEGTVIIPCEFEDIEYIGGNFLKFKSGDSWGVITMNSKVIIPTSRGYTSIGKYSTVQKTIPFTKPGQKGECNSLGRVISVSKTDAIGDSSKKSNTKNTNTSSKSNATAESSSGKR